MYDQSFGTLPQNSGLIVKLPKVSVIPCLEDLASLDKTDIQMVTCLVERVGRCSLYSDL